MTATRICSSGIEVLELSDAVTIIRGDCLEALPGLKERVHSIITDPPYGIRFMGKKWDHSVPSIAIWKAALRVLEPGGHALIACGTRTQHRMAVNVEDAGFEIRDVVLWLHGMGFPKSHNISKAIDKAAGACGHSGKKFNVVGKSGGDSRSNYGDVFRSDHPDYVKPKGITKEAQQWEGWGTALKPACEFFTLVQKPFNGTIANNVLKHSTGGLNIDGCRVGTEERFNKPGTTMGNSVTMSGGKAQTGRSPSVCAGRWPANVTHDGSDEVLALFPEVSSGARKGGDEYKLGRYKGQPGARGLKVGGSCSASSGSAARFFYCAKAGEAERGDGNDHPTVKPIDLMEYLCRLITPPGGTILDPFMGSGTTGIAAIREGKRFVGIERDQHSFDIARRRLEKELQQERLPFVNDVAPMVTQKMEEQHAMW